MQWEKSKHENTMYVGRRVTIRAPSYDSVQFLCDRTMSFKEKWKGQWRLRVNLAQESPAGISVKNPGGARFPGIIWDWLTTQTPGSTGETGQCMRSKHPSAACSAHCSNSPWLLCHLSAFPTYLTPCRLHFISCQLFRETHSGRSWTRGTFWHISGYSEECWQLLEVRGSRRAQQLSQVGGWDEGVVPLHSAQVDHGSVVGHLHRLADAGFASLHHLQLVHGVIHAQGKDFVPWQPLPAAERRAKTCHLLPRSITLMECIHLSLTPRNDGTNV